MVALCYTVRQDLDDLAHAHELRIQVPVLVDLQHFQQYMVCVPVRLLQD
jgi:hypothetical protein